MIFMKVALIRKSPFGTLTGHDSALLRLARLFKSECGASVIAFSLGNAASVSYSSGFEEHILNKGRGQILKELERLKPEVVIVFDRELAGVAKSYNNISKGKANIVILTDSPDVIYNFALRIDSMKIPKLLKPIAKRLYLMRQAMIYKKMIDAATHIILPTEEDKARLAELIPDAESRSYVMQLLPVDKPKEIRTIKEIRNILFVGACDYPPNAEAIRIIEEVIAPSLPNKTFYVIGKGCTPRTHGNFSCLGEVSEKELQRRLFDADLCIAPLLHGTGFKKKTLDYLLYGKPVIGTHVAFQGFAVRDGLNALVEDNPNEFAKRIEELESNPKLIAKIQKNIPTILREFSDYKIKARFRKFCKSLA